MKFYFSYFILVFLLCNASCMSKGNNDTKEKEVFCEKPVVLDSLTIMCFNADELIKRNGKPASDMKFLMKETTRDKKKLREFFSFDSDMELRELKWNIDSEIYLLIWYVEKDDDWKPLTFSFRYVQADY